MTILFLFNLIVSALYASFLFVEVIIPDLSIRIVRFQANSRKYILPSLWFISLILVILNFSYGFLSLLILQTIFMIMGIRLHQDQTFIEITDPEFEEDLTNSPIKDSDTVIVVDINGEVKVYPLVYVAHHHVVNDQINGFRLAITFCPMCHSVMVYDTSEIGRMYVATIHKGNLVLADYGTRTYFQQNTGKYLTGPLKGKRLVPKFYEQLSFQRAKEKYPDLQVVKVSKEDLSPFDLPIPGLWSKLLKSEFVPTLNKKKVDKRLPPRERVIGIDLKDKSLAYRKDLILQKGYIQNKETEFLLISVGEQVEGYKYPREKEYSGEIKETSELEKIQVSDEYWFAWSYFHPMTKLVEA